MRPASAFEKLHPWSVGAQLQDRAVPDRYRIRNQFAVNQSSVSTKRDDAPTTSVGNELGMRPRNERIRNDDVIGLAPADANHRTAIEFPRLNRMPLNGIQ